MVNFNTLMRYGNRRLTMSINRLEIKQPNSYMLDTRTQVSKRRIDSIQKKQTKLVFPRKKCLAFNFIWNHLRKI